MSDPPHVITILLGVKEKFAKKVVETLAKQWDDVSFECEPCAAYSESELKAMAKHVLDALEGKYGSVPRRIAKGAFDSYKMFGGRTDRQEPEVSTSLEEGQKPPPEPKAGGGAAGAVCWSKPDSIKVWAKVFDVHPNTMRTWLKDGNVHAEQVSGRRWKIDVRELPSGYQEDPPQK
jgi:hypothetical protein